MSFEALPTIYDFTDPSTNLADGTEYLSYDGQHVGYGAGCDPMSQHTALAGIMPEYIEKNRILWGAAFALPLFAALYGFSRTTRFRYGALWALGAYIAPLPTAGLAALQMSPNMYYRGMAKRRRNYRWRR